MKTIGLIGGITWHSTLDYYRLINQLVNEQVGGITSAKIILHSIEFSEIKVLTEANRWDDLASLISSTAQKIEQAGADCILIGANTMHRIADQVRASINIPLIHIAEETAKAIAQKQLKKVALLGTKYTMQLDFYTNKLVSSGITTIIPGSDEEIEIINNAIYREMSKGIFLPETKRQYLEIIERLIDRGAEGIILGCTEIPILLKQADCNVPIFDTTYIHAKAAVDFALKTPFSLSVPK